MSKKEKVILSVFSLMLVLIIIASVMASILFDRRARYRTFSDGTVVTAFDAGKMIRMQDAVDIALENSGVTDKSSVVFTEKKIDFSHGSFVYEIDFHDYETEYEYDIDFASGIILSKSFEPYNAFD